MAILDTKAGGGLGRGSGGKLSSVIEAGGGEAVFNLVVSRMLYSITPLAAVWLICSIARAGQTGWQPIYTMEVFGFGLVCLSFIFRKRLSPRWVAVSFLTCLALLSTTGLFSFGMAAAGGMMGLVGTGILAGTIYGKKAGFIAVLFGLAVLLVTGIGMNRGFLPLFSGNLGDYAHSTTAWITAGANLTLIGVVLILCISAIQERLMAAAQSAQIESEFTDMALNTQQDMFFVFNLETKKVLRWNNAFRQITGLSDAEITARPMPDAWADIVDMKETMEAMSRLVKGSNRYFETEVTSIDGRRTPIEFRGVVTKKPALGGTLVIGVGRDLTARREAEQALRESEERFRLVSDNVPTVVWTADHQGNPTYVSPNIEKVCGYNAVEILEGGSAFWSAHIHEEDRELYGNSFTTLTGAGQNADLKYRFKTENGKTIWLHHQAAPVSGKDGSVSACGVWSDITEQVITVQELHQAEKMQAVGRLAGGIAHDFNNQIMAITGCAELLAKETRNKPRLHEYVDHIRTAAGFAASLTDQLLAFSRKTVGRERPQDVHHLIHQTVSILERSITRHIRISQIPSATCAVVSADVSMLQNVLLNLCLNARDAMPDGGEMTIATQDVVIPEKGDPTLPELVPGSYLCIEVSDNGCGMDEETRERIFEPFFTTKPEGKGTGFGLAGVLNFVKNRRGTVHVRSTVGVGTAVSLYLPMDEASVGRISTHADGKTDQGCILLIDDDAEVSKNMANMLEEFGYRVEHFDNGLGAVDRYRKNPNGVDLVILDWVMPELSGKDTFTALMAVNENIKVLLASARVTEDEVKSVLARGAAGYIEKPFSAKELVDKIDAALRRETQSN